MEKINNINLHICPTSNRIYTSKKINIKSWSEFGQKKQIIPTNIISKDIKIGYEIESILLFPCTHIINLWHLIHHIYLAYKHLKLNNIKNIDTLFFVFFKKPCNFKHKQKGICNPKPNYLELIFKSLGADLNKFKIIYKIFEKKMAINVKKIFIVDQELNFEYEKQFNFFKKDVLFNFGITLKDKRSITFILRKTTRKIQNIRYVKRKLRNYKNIRYIYLEDYSIDEQLRIISNTDILIGLHGAGLTWCVFMKNNSLLIELYPEYFNTDNYSNLCKLSAIRYKRLGVYGSIKKKDISYKQYRYVDVYFKKKHIKMLKDLLH
tara:strand:+ start:112 stop:1074 length:963 start_codon:yes stop_codon:yes gene_type:complete